MTREPANESAFEVDEYPPVRRSLRIAIVTETFPPEVNGVAATIASFAEGLHALNHEVQLIRPRQASAESSGRHRRFDEVLMAGLPIPSYPDLKMGLPSKRSLVRLWKERRPDLVHVVTEGPLGWSAVQAARTLHLPVCSDFRTNFHSYSRHYGIGWLQRPILAYLRKFHNRTLLTMVPTELLRHELSQAGFQNLRVVARGVDTKLFNPARRRESLRRAWGADPDSVVVLHVGRLAPEKNVGLLADVYARLRRAEPTASMVFVGDGPARAELQRRCPDAVFAGMRAGEDLAAHYASGDVFVFPSVTETFGNVTTEAMASGLAIVAYDYAAAGQLIESGVNGVAVPCDNNAAFLAATLQLVADRATTRRLGAHARATAEMHSWERVVAQLEALFLQVIDRAVVPPRRRLSEIPVSLTR